MSIETALTALQGDITAARAAVTAKGGTVTSGGGSSQLAGDIATIPSGGGRVEAAEKDINFYDCDGFRLYSWTLAELRTATELPPNPTRPRLTAQGWNWTLAELKDLDAQMDVGQIYTTEDEKTHLVIDVPLPNYSLYVGFASNGESSIEWGDGHTDSFAGSSTTEVVFTRHVYDMPGEYVIRLGGSVYLKGDSEGSVLLTANGEKESGNSAYARMPILRELNMSVSVKAAGYDRPLQNASGLRILTIPNGTGATPRVPSCDFYAAPATNSALMGTITYYAGFGNTKRVCCSKKEHFGEETKAGSIIRYMGYHGTFLHYGALWKSSKVVSARIYGTFTSTNHHTFDGCSSLQEYYLPDTPKSIGNYAFRNCYALEEIRITRLVTTIGSEAFANCISLKRLVFSPTVPPTVSNSNAFSGINPSCKILIPRGTIAAYTSATNYPSASTFTYEEYDP